MGTDQRDTSIHASTVDLDEAYKVGQKAVLVAAEEGGGWMSTILREPGGIYNVKFDKGPLEDVANSERSFPANWITKDRIDVTDDFVRWAMPLIGEPLPKMTRLKAGGTSEAGPGAYVPQGLR